MIEYVLVVFMTVKFIEGNYSMAVESYSQSYGQDQKACQTTAKTLRAAYQANYKRNPTLYGYARCDETWREVASEGKG